MSDVQNTLRKVQMRLLEDEEEASETQITKENALRKVQKRLFEDAEEVSLDRKGQKADEPRLKKMRKMAEVCA